MGRPSEESMEDDTVGETSGFHDLNVAGSPVGAVVDDGHAERR